MTRLTCTCPRHDYDPACPRHGAHRNSPTFFPPALPGWQKAMDEAVEAAYAESAPERP